MAVVGGTFTLNTGYKIPYFGLGLFQIRDAKVIKDAIKAALESGYRLFDTAKAYGNEQEIGDAITELLPTFGLKRENIFITTKVKLTVDDNKASVREQVVESLRQLQTPYLDLVLIHYPRPNFHGTPGSNTDPKNKDYRRDAYEELLRLKGAFPSVYLERDISHLKHLDEAGLPTPSVNQLQFHPHLQRRELKKYCEEQGIFFQAFTSLGRNDPRLLEDPKVVSVAQNHGETVQRVLLAYCLYHKAGVLPKSATPSRIADNIKAVDVKLTTEDVLILDSAENGNSYSPTEGWNVL